MAKPRKPAQPKVGIDSVSQTNTKAIALASIGVVVVLALVVGAIFVFGDSDDTDGANTDVVEFRPVTVTGDPLPPQYSDAEGKQLNEAIGTQAPDLKGASFDGTPINITKDGRGKALIFLAHWCQHCQREAPLLSSWIPKNKDKYPDVDFYAVATSSRPTSANYPPSDWLKKEKWPTKVMADNNTYDAADAFGLGSFPYFVFLDGNNKVVTRTSGEIGMSDFGNHVQRVQDAVKGVTPTTAAPGATTTAAPQTLTPQP